MRTNTGKPRGRESLRQEVLYGPTHPHRFGSVSGRGGQVDGSTDMRTSWAGVPGAHYPVSRVAVSGGRFEGAEGTTAQTTSRKQARAIQRQNRKAYRAQSR